MDYTNQNLGGAGSGLEINPTIASYLEETRKWIVFLAVLGFIGVGLMVLAGLFFLLMPGDSLMGQGMPGMRYVGPLYLVIALLYIIPLLYMMRFSSDIKNALAMKDNGFLTSAFRNLKSLFKFMGILAIVVLSLYAVGIVVAVIVGIAGIF